MRQVIKHREIKLLKMIRRTGDHYCLLFVKIHIIHIKTNVNQKYPI